MESLLGFDRRKEFDSNFSFLGAYAKCFKVSSQWLTGDIIKNFY